MITHGRCRVQSIILGSRHVFWHHKNSLVVLFSRCCSIRLFSGTAQREKWRPYQSVWLQSFCRWITGKEGICVVSIIPSSFYFYFFSKGVRPFFFFNLKKKLQVRHPKLSPTVPAFTYVLPRYTYCILYGAWCCFLTMTYCTVVVLYSCTHNTSKISFGFHSRELGSEPIINHYC